MEDTTCYIDKRLCTGARFSFCDDCKKAQITNQAAIKDAKTPAELTEAHISKKQ